MLKAEDLVNLIRAAQDAKWHTGMRGVFGAHPTLPQAFNNNTPKQEFKPVTPKAEPKQEVIVYLMFIYLYLVFARRFFKTIMGLQ